MQTATMAWSLFRRLKVSTENINRRDRWSHIDPAPAGKIVYYPTTFSFPIAEPSALVLPDIATIHRMLTSVRTNLMAVQSGMAGEFLALDYLNVALQATDLKGHNAFQNKTPAERYQLTTDTIAKSQSFLNSLDAKNPALKGVIDLLRGTKFLVDNALSNRWPIMVQ